MRRDGRRGSLIATMFVIAVIVVVAFSLTVMSFHHWSFAQYAHNRQVAKNLAESVASLAVANVIANPTFGTGSPPPAYLVTLSDPDNPGAVGYATFNPTQATALKIPLSLNNQSEASVDGFTMRVPRRTAQIVAHAEYQKTTFDTMVLVHVPPYPLALVASGPIVSTGGLVVSGVRNARDYTGSISSLPASKRAMATVASNSGDPSAVSLGSGTVINGNVQACGGINVAPGGVVKGAVMPASDPAPVPALDVASMFATNMSPKAYSGGFPLPSTVTDLDVEWLKRCNGSLTVYGNITMNGGALFVTGDLHVTGSVSGQGTIVVGGATTIDRGAELNADNVVALMSHGLITLRGQDKTHSYLQGLVYSETGVAATRLTVLGTLMTRAPAGAGAVFLEDVNVVCAPVNVQTRAGLPFGTDVDDDETIFSAYAYPNPADPTGKDMRFTVTAIPFKDGVKPDMDWALTATNMTRKQAAKFIIDLDNEAPHPGGVGHTISNNGGLPKLKKYFDDLENPPTAPKAILNLDINRLLKPALQPRILLWRSL